MRPPSFSTDDDTIFAVSSGIARAAVSVIRLSGSGADAALQALGVAKLPAPRMASLRLLRDAAGEPLDRALVLRFPAPNSFTGEAMAELQVTGGRAIVNAILKALAARPGLRPAEPGEFAWRAFRNGKLDLSQAEGLADLVDSETEAQRRQALRIADGALSRQTEAIRALLVEAMALIEAQIDFSDQEDADSLTLAAIREPVERAAAAMREALAGAEAAEALRDGFTVVIAGAPNVGKSTLMNALARRDVSIVSDIPGTTRDAIEVHLDLGGYPVTLIDTAGQRDSADPIEREGVARARAKVASADLTLWLSDSDAAPPAPDGALTLRTKIDRAGGAPPRTGLAVSAKTGEGLPALLDAIAVRAEERFAGAGPALITMQRHRAAFEEALRWAQSSLGHGAGALELAGEDLRRAARALQRIAGRIDVEEVLGAIFSRLCIGK